jgi:hypothetical protein
MKLLCADQFQQHPIPFHVIKPPSRPACSQMGKTVDRIQSALLLEGAREKIGRLAAVGHVDRAAVAIHKTHIRPLLVTQVRIFL